MLGERFTQAVDYARRVHGSEVRTGTSIPYLAHLLGVAGLVLRYGGDEDQAIAALLHATIARDGPRHGRLIRAEFGDRVARIAAGCAGGLCQWDEPRVAAKARQAERDQRRCTYLARIEDAPDDALLVAGCDALDGARGIMAAMRDPPIGIRVFARFTGGPNDALAHYRALVNCFVRRGSPVARDLADAVASITAATPRPQPARCAPTGLPQAATRIRRRYPDERCCAW